MSYEWTGLAYQEEQTGSQAYFIFALSITLVYLVLAAQYESWTDPIAVILVVPTALIGILVALVIRKFPVDLYTSHPLRRKVTRKLDDEDRILRRQRNHQDQSYLRCRGRS